MTDDALDLVPLESLTAAIKRRVGTAIIATMRDDSDTPGHFVVTKSWTGNYHQAMGLAHDVIDQILGELKEAREAEDPAS